jgi:hypothetical protein
MRAITFNLSIRIHAISDSFASSAVNANQI